MAINIVNPEKIDGWLAGFALSADGSLINGCDAQMHDWLKTALSGALKRHEASAVELFDLPEDAPDWLSNKWDVCGPFHEFDPYLDRDLHEQVARVAEWLRVARDHGADFLTDTAANGMPKILNHINTVEDAVKLADGWLEKFEDAYRRMNDPGVETVMTFEDGFRVVKINAASSLRPEGLAMGHCLGKPQYNHAGDLARGETAYYSLRDTNNRPHATFAVRVSEHALLQCMGKQDEPPHEKYIPYAVDFIGEQGLALKGANMTTGLIEQDGAYYDMFNLPKDFHYRGDLVIHETGRAFALPEGLKVDGKLALIDCPNAGPVGEKTHVGKELYISACPGAEHLPSRLTVAGRLMVSGDGVHVPDSVKCEKLLINHREVERKPAGLRRRLMSFRP